MVESNPGDAGRVAVPGGAAQSGASLPPHTPAWQQQAASYGTEAQQTARQWIAENQTLAVLAGFAFGVFIGVMMRG